MIQANRFHHTFAREPHEHRKPRRSRGRRRLDVGYLLHRRARGRLVYRGYDVDDLVEQSSFEEVVYLLWHGGLPSKKELVAHTKAISVDRPTGSCRPSSSRS